MRIKLDLLPLIAVAILIAVHASAALADTTARETLSNGLRVVVEQNRLAPVVSIHVNYLVGSNESPPGFPGTAHALEHMMFRGSPGISGDQINTILANVGGDSNAFTDPTVTQYVSTVPVGDLEAMLHLEAIRMKEIDSQEAQWRLERGAINQEVAGDLSSPMYALRTRLLNKLFEGTPYDHDALGSADSFRKTSGAMLKKFHHSWYAPNNAILVIVGDVDPPQIIEMVKKLFGDIPSRTLPARATVNLKPLKTTELKVHSNEPYGLAVVAYRLPGIEDKDYAAGQVLSTALASPRGKIYELAEQGAVLAAFFDSMPLPKATGGLAVAAAAAGEDLHQKVKLLKKVIAEYVAEGIPAELVESVKRHAVTDAESDKDSIPELAEAWSQALAKTGYSSPDEELAAIRKVTVDDVNRVARSYLLNDSAITALMLPGNSRKPAIVVKKFKRSSESFIPKSIKPVKQPVWAQDVVKTPAVADQTAPITDLRLANGLRLIVKTFNSSNLITLSGTIKNTPELQIPKGKEGLSDLLDELLSQGTISLNRVQYQSALDEIGASATLGTDFSIKVPGEHFEKGVSLLSDALLHPLFPESAFRIIKKQAADLLTGQKNSPEWVQNRAYLESLHPKEDPVLRYDTPESVSGLTLQDIREYHASVFRPDLTTIVITGKIDPANARAIVERYFGAWIGSGQKPETDFKPIPDNKPKSILVPDDGSQQADVILAQTSKLNRAHPDYYPFQLGMCVLSGSSASRLYQSLREKRGLVYSVDAEFKVGKTRSIFRVAYDTAPKNVAKVRTLIERDINDMRKYPVSLAELDQAKNTMARQLVMVGTSTDSIASVLLGLSSEDLPLNLPSFAARQVRQVTQQQVQEAFKRWIRPGGFVQITSKPMTRPAGKR